MCFKIIWSMCVYSLQSAIIYLSRDTELWGNEGVNVFYDYMEYVCFFLQSTIIYSSTDTELWGKEEGDSMFYRAWNC